MAWPRPFGIHLTGSGRRRHSERKMPEGSAKPLPPRGSGRQLLLTETTNVCIIPAVSTPFPRPWTGPVLTRYLSGRNNGGGGTDEAFPGGFAERGHQAAGISGPGGDRQTFSRLLPVQTIKRPSVPAGLADVLAFLVSDDAGFMTGQIMPVAGGLTRAGA